MNQTLKIRFSEITVEERQMTVQIGIKTIYEKTILL